MFIGIRTWSRNMKEKKIQLIDELTKWNKITPSINYNREIAKQMSLFSALAYLSDNKQTVKQHLKSYKVTKLAYFDVDGTEAMLFKSGKSVVVAFRGTEPTELKDVIADLNLFPTKGETQGMVHRGFAKALDNIWNDVERVLDETYTKGDVVYFTGHSLGGALATVAAARSKYIGQVYTFGQPRVGTKKYCQSVKSKFYRHVHGADIVPSVPFGLMYTHMGEYINVEMNNTTPLNSSWIIFKTRWKNRWNSFFSRRPLVNLISDHDIILYYKNI
jgi:triacylglycerol lipase